MPFQMITSTDDGGVAEVPLPNVVIVNDVDDAGDGVKNVFSNPDAVPTYTRYDDAPDTAVHDAVICPVENVVNEDSGLASDSLFIASRAVTTTK